MSKEKKQSKMPKNYNPSEWVAIGHSNGKISIEQPENQITFMKKPQDIKVMIWGYELCTGAEWKDFLDVVNKLGKEKADLEAKLAESEKEIKEWIAVRDDKNNVINKQTEKINQLKQQLAEKEKEIEDMKNNHYLLKKDYIVDYFVSQTNEPMPIPKFVTNQDKISFAVEQLDKVKELIEEKYAYVIDECDYGVVYEDEIDKIFDNQIEELKKEMK